LCGTPSVPDDAAVKNAAAIVVVLMLLAGCSTGSPGDQASSTAAPTSLMSMCAKVSDDDASSGLAKAGAHWN
jgi:hypothetical protein